MATFRAVENGKYLVRAANTGITAVVDPRGRVLEPTPTLRPDGPRARRARSCPGRTFYARYGDVFAWGCFAVAASLAAATFRGRPSSPDGAGR